MISSDKIKHILQELGYKLSDKGNYWQCSAIYRNGDNPTALQIYKDTGAWKDYVQNTPFMPFKQLLILTLNTNDPQEIGKYLNKEESFFLASQSREIVEQIKSEEIYPESILEKLLPHYKFYNDRGISNEILIKLKGGLATRSQMYQRFVFPIYNEYGQIHGFSGRDLSGKEGKPKWKHMGKKKQWVYPAYVPYENSFLIDSVESEFVILVESIGDALSCMEHGFNNVLVSFGLDLSSKLICSLIKFNFKQIILSFNNDEGSEDNRGMIACIKNYLKLLSCFDASQVKICLPNKNDFGDMNANDFNKWKEKLNLIQESNQIPKIINLANKMQKLKQLPRSVCKNLKLLNE
jgi:hypothetical protein